MHAATRTRLDWAALVLGARRSRPSRSPAGGSTAGSQAPAAEVALVRAPARTRRVTPDGRTTWQGRSAPRARKQGLGASSSSGTRPAAPGVRSRRSPATDRPRRALTVRVTAAASASSKGRSASSGREAPAVRPREPRDGRSEVLAWIPRDATTRLGGRAACTVELDLVTEAALMMRIRIEITRTARPGPRARAADASALAQDPRSPSRRSASSARSRASAATRPSRRRRRTPATRSPSGTVAIEDNDSTTAHARAREREAERLGHELHPRRATRARSPRPSASTGRQTGTLASYMTLDDHARDGRAAAFDSCTGLHRRRRRTTSARATASSTAARSRRSRTTYAAGIVDPIAGSPRLDDERGALVPLRRLASRTTTPRRA